MTSWTTIKRSAMMAAVCMLLMGVLQASARAGEFEVANCQADGLNFSTRAFGDFATRGMEIKRACDPEGPGLRGLITRNVVRRGRVERGAQALVTLSAPPGTRFTTFTWAGTAHRRDCRYALQLYADAPDVPPIALKNVRANRNCPHGGLTAQAAGYRSRTYNIPGTTRIVQRVVCVGAREQQYCSGRGANYLRTYEASVRITDSEAPAVTVLPDTPLARGEWVSGSQPLNYDASDNVGVRLARAFIDGRQIAFQNRPCALAGAEGAYSQPLACANGPGQITVNTKGALDDGSYQLVVQAEDTASNLTNSGVLVARIDNTPPPRVNVAVEGGQDWRNTNDFAVGWSNPLEADRAPITAANYELCAADGGSCTRGQQTGAEIARLSLAVPAPGQWSLKVWAADAAGNQADDNASVPVLLRYDPEPPQLAFEAPAPSDPTRVSVLVSDRVSGLASGQIEIGRQNSGVWQALPTTVEDSRLVARIDDVALPAGTYALRARAIDRAHNEASSDSRTDGQPMILSLPVRSASVLQAGVVRNKTRIQTVRRHGKRRKVRQRVTEVRPGGRVAHDRQIRVVGRLTTADGLAVTGAEVDVFSRSTIAAEQLAAVVHTDANGAYEYTAAAGTSGVLRFAYAGSPVTLPASTEIGLRVPATGSLRVNHRHVLNGQSVTFSGRLETLPVPPGGKLVELQVRLSGRWQTFRTTRTDAAGDWTIPYQFKRTRGLQRFRFRLALPDETGYPFESGHSGVVTVRVRGQA